MSIEDRAERLGQPSLPIDERAVAVEGQGVDIAEVDLGRHPRNCSPYGIVGAA